MNEHFIFQVVTIIMIATVLLYIPISVIALTKKVLKPLDFICPFITVSIWLALTVAGVGPKDTANLIEIPLIMFITLLACIHMMFSPFSKLRTQKGTIIIVTILSVIALLTRLYIHVLHS
jgi:hypothetical protein